jgi:hypothetical protein
VDAVTAAAMLAGPTHPAVSTLALAAALAATKRDAERAESPHHTATGGAAVYPPPPPVGTPNTHPGTTPAPVYVPEPPRPPVGEQVPNAPTRMDHHERMRMRAAAWRATRLYPGPVGMVLQRELLCWEEFGYRLGSHGVIGALVDHVMKTPLHQDGPTERTA